MMGFFLNQPNIPQEFKMSPQLMGDFFIGYIFDCGENAENIVK